MMHAYASSPATARPEPRSDAESTPAPWSVHRTYQRGAMLTCIGDPASVVYLVQAGHIRVFRCGEAGRETTTAILGRGQLVGIEGLVGREVYGSFAQAITPAEVWAMPVERLLPSLGDDPTLLRLFVSSLSHRYGLTQVLLRDVALNRVAERIPAVLARLEPCLGGEKPRLTRELLAGLVGARPETISRARHPARRAS